MKNTYLVLFLLLSAFHVKAQSDKVSVMQDQSGVKLMINGHPHMINGMNWDYYPIGTNHSYSLWNQPEGVIQSALDSEMSLLKNIGVNTIRVYVGIPPKWITYIYNNYGIYTMLNHPFGRYGLLIDGAWVTPTDYDNITTRNILMVEVFKMVRKYKDTPGLLFFTLGNENNYGLFWENAETKDIPEKDKHAVLGELRGRPMYRLMNRAALSMKQIDPAHPVAISNGGLMYANIIAEECTDVDIYGFNLYRGESFGDAFEKVKKQLNKPIVITEFGSDAYNAATDAEDQKMQAHFVTKNWEEIYQNAAGLGKAGNVIGGFTFQFSDSWWKYAQNKNLDLHDTHAYWSSKDYYMDYREEAKNMNAEWFGICAKGRSDARGLYTSYPRAAYYALKKAHEFNPYAKNATLQQLNDHFKDINLEEAYTKALTDAVTKTRHDKAMLNDTKKSKLSLSRLRAEYSTFYTGGKLITTPDTPELSYTRFPNSLGFDHMDTYYVGFEANPTENVRAEVTFNVLGHVAQNPIDQIFYEAKRRPQVIATQNGRLVETTLDRLQLYQAEYHWNHDYFHLKGFHRVGRGGWADEGDFFGLYRIAYYGANADIYNGRAPQGLEIAGKKVLKGLKVAYGRELWWAANPAILAKYHRDLGKIRLSGVYHQDLEGQNSGEALTSEGIPQPQTRRATLYAKSSLFEGKLNVEAGGIWGGQPLVGRTFQIAEENGEDDSYTIFTDKVQDTDTWGGKVKVTFRSRKINWYAQAATMGLVASGGGDYLQTFTGWRLRDSGSGNQNNFLSGFTYDVGKFQIAPNFLYQKPLVDPMPAKPGGPGRLRNILDDPFIVRKNRETVGGELLLTFDPTPNTSMYRWDSDKKEDAGLAASLRVIYRHLPTTQDAPILFTGPRQFAPARGVPPALDLWEITARIVSKVNTQFGIVANLYGGNGQARGPDTRSIERFGGDVRIIYKKIKFSSFLKINDWGPYDFHHDYNLTFPIQTMADLSMAVGKPDWLILPSTTLGMRFTWRSLDQYSPRYSPSIPVGFGNGNEWELRTYVHINIGK